jgi:RNA polymerase sigma-70 factor, ECF subfamily
MSVDFESLYQTYGPVVLRRCRRFLRDEGKALDAMHDVFVEIMRRRDTLRGGSPLSLLIKTATHVCLNRLRGERRHPEDREEALLIAIANQGAECPESRALAQRALDRLFDRTPDSTRLIAVLHYVDRLTLKEVAAETGLSVSGVRWRLRRLQERLPCLTKEEMDDARTRRSSA